MLNRVIFQTVAVTLQVPTGTRSRIKFDEQPLLRNMRIMAIEAFTADQVAATDDGNPVIAAGASDAGLITCTFQDHADERFRAIPYQKLVADQNAGAVMQFGGLVANWPACYVSSNGPGITTEQWLYFLVHYATPEQVAQHRIE
jgi:hypothetical protein